ncbi:phage tail assembly chaperone [Methylopila jiangsuensis]|uniref:phage tail assembly chaperone n=1 Tax=Methylopila jiangsuensis TaxID=586230 RepID=UPI003D179110
MERLEKKGREVPADYLNRPELEPEGAFYFDAFFRLSPSRRVGFSEGPIPFEAIDAFARRWRIWGSEFDRFERMIRALDSEHLTKRSAGKDDPQNLTSMKDAAGLRALLQSVGSKGG